MPHPTPPVPTNANPFNDYPGIDRGLFRSMHPDYPYARLHSAIWEVEGPAPCPGLMTFTLMGYTELPATAADYKNGTILATPKGNHTAMNCIVRGPISQPILAEFYARNIWLKHYINHGDLLTEEEISKLDVYKKELLEPLGSRYGLQKAKLTMNFEPTSDGMPLVRGTTKVEYSGVFEEQPFEGSLFITEEPFDPVRAALSDIRKKRKPTDGSQG